MDSSTTVFFGRHFVGFQVTIDGNDIRAILKDQGIGYWKQVPLGRRCFLRLPLVTVKFCW